MIWLDATDLLVGIGWGIYMTMNFYKPVLPVKVTKLPPDIIEKPSRGWQEAVQPVVAQLTVAAHFSDKVTYNQKGAAAIAKLLRDMSVKLDHAVGLQLAERPGFTMKTVTKASPSS
jgi:hypothetical protein